MQEAQELCDTLSPVTQSPNVPVVGLELASDLRKLSQSYPTVSAFQQVLCTLDLRNLWEVSAQRVGVRKGADGNRMGLSSLSAAVLGKPMDKAMQACSLCTPTPFRRPRLPALPAAADL